MNSRVFGEGRTIDDTIAEAALQYPRTVLTSSREMR